jgi:hypothetical protein
MWFEKRVRTKKRVAYVCYFARDAARAIEGGFWTLADAVQARKANLPASRVGPSNIEAGPERGAAWGAAVRHTVA